MGRGLPLAPCGLVVEQIQSEAGDLVITAHPALRTAACPACGSASARVHSTYQRSLAHLPSHGQTVRIRVSTRRFRCVLGVLPSTDIHGTARRDGCTSVVVAQEQARFRDRT
jgi:transposase